MNHLDNAQDLKFLSERIASARAVNELNMQKLFRI